MKGKNIFFILLFCSILASPSFLLMARMVNVDVPAYLSSDEANYLLGASQLSSNDGRSMREGFFSGTLQDDVESKISSFIPAKASALLMNAAIQRCFIEISNAAFSWECYPTFYGSGSVYLPSHNALALMPEKDRDEIMEGIAGFCEGLCMYASHWPERNINIVLTDQSYFSESNPAVLLSSDTTTTAEVQELMVELTNGADNISVVSIPYSNPDDYYMNYYHADHHWNGWGAIESYCALAGLEELPASFFNLRSADSSEGLVFNGSNARNGLMLLNQPVNEPELNNDLSVESGAEGYFLQNEGYAALRERGKYAEFNFYAAWYGSDSANVIRNERGSGNKLVISDSNGDVFRWLVAQDSFLTYDFYDLYRPASGDATLDSRIATSGSDEVIFVGAALGYSSFLERFPHYFDSEK